MSHEEAAELLGAFAVDALEPDEALALRQHLIECHRCSQELAQYHEVVGLLASTGGDAPEHLWERIAEQVESTEHPTDDRDVIIGLLGAKRAPTRPETRHGRRFFPIAGAVAAAAALVVIALLGLQVAHLDHRVGQLNAASERQGLVQAAQAALLDPKARSVTLTANDSSGPALAQIVMLPSGSAFVINSGLRSLPSTETYQLWGKVGSRLVSFALLGNRPRDVAFTVSPSASVAGFAVTAQQAGGVVRPTHPPVAESPGLLI